jgi:hypothetical protein
VDGDGHVDVITTCVDDGMTVRHGVGDGSFERQTTFSALPAAELLAIPLDGGAAAHVVSLLCEGCADDRPQLEIYDDAGTLLALHGGATPNAPHSLVGSAGGIVAIGGDGPNNGVDLALLGRPSLTGPTGTFADDARLDLGEAVTGVALGDLDGDGITDVAIAHANGVSVLRSAPR